MRCNSIRTASCEEKKQRSRFLQMTESPIQCSQGPLQPFLLQFLPSPLWFHFLLLFLSLALPQVTQLITRHHLAPGPLHLPSASVLLPRHFIAFSHMSFRSLYKILLLSKFYPDVLIQNDKGKGRLFLLCFSPQNLSWPDTPRLAIPTCSPRVTCSPGQLWMRPNTKS